MVVRLTPPLAREYVCVPVSGLPSLTDLTRSKTPVSTFLTTEVRIVSLYLDSAGSRAWSESTPMDQAPFW